MELDMTEGKPLPLILRFVFPLFIGNVFQQLYNMVDTVIVGRYVGSSALAAVGSTGTIMFLITGFAQGLPAFPFSLPRNTGPEIHTESGAVWETALFCPWRQPSF